MLLARFLQRAEERAVGENGDGGGWEKVGRRKREQTRDDDRSARRGGRGDLSQESQP